MLSPASVVTPKRHSPKSSVASDGLWVDRTRLLRVGRWESSSKPHWMAAVRGWMARESSSAPRALVPGAGCGPWFSSGWILTLCGAVSPHSLSLQQDSLRFHSMARFQEGEKWKLSGLSRVRPRTSKTSLSLHSHGVSKSEGQAELQGLGNVCHFLLIK